MTSSARDILYKKWKALLHEEKKRRASLWEVSARPNQRIPPGDWRVWLIMAGRGFGKTRTGAETVRIWSAHHQRICLLGQTMEDVRRIMIEGESGLLSVCAPQSITYSIRKNEVRWKNGSMAIAHSGDAFSQLRGPQFHAAWIDELAKFHHPEEAWDQLMFCLRLGAFPRVIVTTTPRPIPLLHKILKRPDVVVTTGSTMENVEHLPKSYVENLMTHYGNTRTGAQEIHGTLLSFSHDALWKPHFFSYASSIPPLTRLIVAIDPAASHHEKSDETGIIVAGKDASGAGYILEDLSGRYTPTQWGKIVVDAFHRYEADLVVGEINHGGDMVENVLRTTTPQHIPFKAVRATRGKILRAEPIVMLYEQGRIFHKRYFPSLEEQLLSYTGEARMSPDRLDALVWALTELFLHDTPCHHKIWSMDMLS